MTTATHVDQLDAAADLLTGNNPDADSEPGPENIYPDVVPFVTDYLGPLYARTWAAGRELHWCEQWWNHPEAVVRLTALWLSWETARLQPDGILGWLRDADANLDRLTLSTGTFSQCGPSRHKPQPALPTSEPPAHLFPPLSTAAGGHPKWSTDQLEPTNPRPATVTLES